MFVLLLFQEEKEFVDLKLAHGRVSKLLHEIVLDLGLNLLLKLQFTYSGFGLP